MCILSRTGLASGRKTKKPCPSSQGLNYLYVPERKGPLPSIDQHHTGRVMDGDIHMPHRLSNARMPPAQGRSRRPNAATPASSTSPRAFHVCDMRTDSRRSILDEAMAAPSWPVDWWVGMWHSADMSLKFGPPLRGANLAVVYATLSSDQGTLQGVQGGEAGSKRTGFRRG